MSFFYNIYGTKEKGETPVKALIDRCLVGYKSVACQMHRRKALFTEQIHGISETYIVI